MLQSRLNAGRMRLRVGSPLAQRVEGGLAQRNPPTLSPQRRKAPLSHGDFARRANQWFVCPVPFAKIFRFSFEPNHLYISCIPGPTQGRFAVVTNVGQGMRWTRVAPKTRALSCGRRSRVVLTPRRWRQVLEKQASWGRRWQTSPVTGESAK